jgi:hypothetical protein
MFIIDVNQGHSGSRRSILCLYLRQRRCKQVKDQFEPNQDDVREGRSKRDRMMCFRQGRFEQGRDEVVLKDWVTR